MYLYKVFYYNEVTNTEQESVGMTAGENYLDIMKAIETWFGKDNIISIFASYVGEDCDVSIVELTDEVMEKIAKLNAFSLKEVM